MRLSFVVPAILLVEPWTVQTTMIGQRPFSNGYYQPIDERQERSSSEDENINKGYSIARPITRLFGNTPRALEVRAAIPMPPPPLRTSHSDGYYQPIVCSSRFGTHITVLDSLRLIYDPGLPAMDHIQFISETVSAGMLLPYAIHSKNPGKAFALITEDFLHPNSFTTERASNIRTLMYRIIIQCVIDGGEVGGQAPLLRGVMITLYGGDQWDGEQSESGSEESEPGDPADRFPTFVPGALTHWNAMQGSIHASLAGGALK
ncbi:hypothetical protein MMC11_006028 [Xylographa trunciseda]|nr:hypothetical protein [Xylographa trunciseda]